MSELTLASSAKRNTIYEFVYMYVGTFHVNILYIHDGCCTYVNAMIFRDIFSSATFLFIYLFVFFLLLIHR